MPHVLDLGSMAYREDEIDRWKRNAANERLRAEAAEAKLAKVVEFVEHCNELCNCGLWDTDQMVTRAECSDCRRAALDAAAKEE